MDHIRRQICLLSRIPAGIWALGFVSLLMDVSSEMIHALLPVYLLLNFGASMEIVGLIDGLAEATAGIVKLLSGLISDRIANRKALTVLGYSLAALAKPVIAFAPSIGWILIGRMTDRIGKGIRGAPRDAMITDIAPHDLRGASFGLRQSLDTVGAFLGPLIAIGVMIISNDNFTLVFSLAILPAVLAPILLIRAVIEPRPMDIHSKKPSLKLSPFCWEILTAMEPRYWHLIAIAGLYALARFGESFLIVRMQQTGLALSTAPIVLVAMNLIYAITAYPAGVLCDKIGRQPIIMIGFFCLFAADILLAFADSLITTGIGVVLWGLHLAFTQGTFAALIADTTPPNRRATGFGLFTLIQAIALLIANYQSGLLWDFFGPGVLFIVNGGIIGLTMICFHRLAWDRLGSQPSQNGP